MKSYHSITVILPVVVLLLVMNYLVFRDSGVTAFRVCLVTFSIEFSAYCSEIFRSGINAVPEGQSRAARALGFNRFQTFRNVVWPQAMIHILPAYSGQFISTVKMTSVAGYISIVDLTKASDIICSVDNIIMRIGAPGMTVTNICYYAENGTLPIVKKGNIACITDLKNHMHSEDGRSCRTP